MATECPWTTDDSLTSPPQEGDGSKRGFLIPKDRKEPRKKKPHSDSMADGSGVVTLTSVD